MNYQSINNDQLSQVLQEGVKLIDIRLPDEWQQTGVIEGSVQLTAFERDGQLNPLFIDKFCAEVTDKNQKVALICRSGKRTSALAHLLSQQIGYSAILNVDKGILGWIAENRKTVK